MEKNHVERIEKSNGANSNLTTHIYSSLFAQLTQTKCNFLSLTLALPSSALNFQFYSMNMGWTFFSVDFHTCLSFFSAGFFCACVLMLPSFNPKNCLHVCFNCYERIISDGNVTYSFDAIETDHFEWVRKRGGKQRKVMQSTHLTNMFVDMSTNTKKRFSERNKRTRMFCVL